MGLYLFGRGHSGRAPVAECIAFDLEEPVPLFGCGHVPTFGQGQFSAFGVENDKTMGEINAQRGVTGTR